MFDLNLIFDIYRIGEMEIMSTTILLVEDNADDAAMTIQSLHQSNIRNKIIHCLTGDQALDFLFHRGEYAAQDDALPGMILLDLNLPGTDGREVLEEIKADHKLRLIPVIVLTTSSDERDVARCYEYGANSYVVKPVNFDGFITAMERLSGYWLEIAVIPKVN